MLNSAGNPHLTDNMRQIFISTVGCEDCPDALVRTAQTVLSWTISGHVRPPI
jgi:hypothetical protein